MSQIQNDSRSIRVTTVTLDEMFSYFPVMGKTKLVKIDVEGYEARVIYGGLNFIEKSKIPFIIFESLKGNIAITENILSNTYSLGYRPYIISPHIGTPQTEVAFGKKLLLPLDDISRIEELGLEHCDILLAR